MANLLNVNKGQDFGTVIKEMAEAGYSFCWQILNPSYYGIPLRRERIFIVGCLGEIPESWTCIGEQASKRTKAYQAHLPIFTATDARLLSKQRQKIVINDNGTLRYFTINERERLMGWPDDHTKYGISDKNETIEISRGQRTKMTGNGVHATVVNKLVEHFFPLK